MTDKEQQQFIFGCIFLLSNKLQMLGDKVTEEITLKQWFLLNILQNMNNKAPNFVEIAKVIGSSRQNVSKMITVLEKKGMVRLQTSARDQRAVNVILTQKSLDYFSARESAGNKLLDVLFSGATPTETAAAATLLWRLLENAEAALKEENR